MDLENAESAKTRIRSKFADISRQQWLVLLLLGLLLAVAALPVSRKEAKETPGLAERDARETEGAAGKSELEEKLTNILSNVEGVGEVQVMLMTGEERDAEGFYRAKEPKVTGVLISAEGADNSVVVREIQEAVKALFQVEPHKIKVMKMK